ncbi:hypothetical protein HYT01_04100 [Candidatus Giovannonibacteria bacterium]|nr:hypothetical protein [Candidatus Giovannonibacteria bacterium]
MLGILLPSISAFFIEIADSIGKYEVANRRESIYTMGFLNYLWGTLIFLAVAVFRGSFIFSIASLPTFGIRLFLEILQTHFGILAVVRAERSSYSLIRTATIPLLLLVDIALGYAIGYAQIAGVIVIFTALVLIFLNNGIKKEGLGFVLFSTLNAVLTISLLKYDITYFNSVEAEQAVMHSLLMLYLVIGAYFIAKENPFYFLKRREFLAQSFSSGSGSAINSFAFGFAPASVVMAFYRTFSVLWSFVFGRIYFKESQLFKKIMFSILIIVGVFLLAK